MKEEKHKIESKVKKKLTKIIGAVIVGALLMMTVGCGVAGKGSRTWIEDKVANIEKVYPTENLEDLFEKFPNGFYIRQIILKDGDNINEGYSYILELRGDKDKKTILGKVEKIRTKGEPYERVLIQQSKVKYKKGEGLVLENPELAEELLLNKHFLFQEVKLNRETFKNWKFEKKEYSYETGVFDIIYNVNNREINNYFSIDENSNLVIRVGGVDISTTSVYKYSVMIKNQEKGIDYYEILSDTKEDIENEEREER